VPAPTNFTEKRPHFSGNALLQNKFDLVYDSVTEEEEMKKIFRTVSNEMAYQ
jgi:hypothetical protein